MRIAAGSAIPAESFPARSLASFSRLTRPAHTGAAALVPPLPRGSPGVDDPVVGADGVGSDVRGKPGP